MNKRTEFFEAGYARGDKEIHWQPYGNNNLTACGREGAGSNATHYTKITCPVCIMKLNKSGIVGIQEII